MLSTLAKSPVISQMPIMPEPASATAIGTPSSRQSSSSSIGSATTMTARSVCLGRGGRFLGKQQGLAPPHARQIHNHQDGQHQEADRHEAIGRADQDRQRAEFSVFMQAAPALDRSGPQYDDAEQERHQEGKIIGGESR